MDDLLNVTLTITPGKVGKYNEDGEWQQVSAGSPFEIKASVQPYKTYGRHKLNFPEGVTQEDILVIYTRYAIRCGNLDKEPDTTIINGFKYYAWRGVDWSMTPLDLNHHEVYFIRLHNEGWPVPPEPEPEPEGEEE